MTWEDLYIYLLARATLLANARSTPQIEDLEVQFYSLTQSYDPTHVEEKASGHNPW